jgi:hypothetical protein
LKLIGLKQKGEVEASFQHCLSTRNGLK